MSLAELLGDKAAARFLASAWPDRHFVVHRKLHELPAILRTPPLRSFRELAPLYQGRVQIAGGEGDDHLQFTVAARPLEYLRRVGLTVFFGDDTSALANGGPEFLRRLEADLGAPQGIGAIRTFCSPAGGGLDVHYDQGETFIVQLEGRKKIWLKQNTTYPGMQFVPGRPPADEHYAEYSGGFPDKPKGGFTVSMKPGSILFVPRGMWHRTVAGGASFSASICVDTPTAIDLLLPLLRLALRQDPSLRRPLYGAWGRDAAPAEAQLSRALTDVARFVESSSPPLLLDAVGATSANALPIRPQTRFQRVPSSTFQFGKRRKDGLTVLTVTTWANQKEDDVNLPPGLVAAARFVAKRKSAFTFAELAAASPQTPRSDLEALVRAFLTCEGLKWLSFPPNRRPSR